MKVVDTNMVVDSKINLTDVVFYNVKNNPFKLYGLYDKEIGRQFTRMDLDTAKTVSEGVWRCAQFTAGGRVRFKTDSEYIVVSLKCEAGNGPWPQMSGLAINGCDMYININGEEIFSGSFIPPLNSNGNYQQVIHLENKELKDITINFPIYAKIDEMHVGIQEGSALLEGRNYINEKKPVVFYGSSITQGGCMSRPGMIYESILSRKYNLNFHNLGFAGNAKGEEEIARYIASLPMSMFVYDYDYNSPSEEELLKTHERMFKIIREKNPKIPIIIMSGISGKDYEGRKRRQTIIKKTYENAKADGDKNVYFIDGLTVFTRYGFGWNEPTIECCHPNDLGFTLMAKAVGELFDSENLIEKIRKDD